VLHPFCSFIGGPSAGGEEKLVQGEVDFSQLGAVKVWIDTARNYQRLEILQSALDSRPHWADEKTDRFRIRSDEKPKRDTEQQL
jgi:nitrilase